MFKQDITRSIGRILKNNQYKMMPLDSRCIYFAKRYSDNLAFYVRCGDNQCINQTVNVKFFFAPIRIPDDRIISMNMGVHINVLEVKEDEYTEEIMVKAGEKIIAIEKKLCGLSSMINNEIELPYFPQGINKLYNDTLVIYDTIMKDENLKEDIVILRNNACANIKIKKSSPTYDLCSELIDKLSINYFKKVGVDLEINRIKNMFSEQLRAQCMLDV